jgi:hypothetical protein
MTTALDISNLFARLPPADALALLKAYGEYKKTVETETTARVDIAARHDVELQSIQAVRDLCREYLDRAFDERRRNFDELFRVLDAAVRSGEPGNVTPVAAAIADIAKSSPLADWAQTRRDLGDRTKKVTL